MEDDLSFIFLVFVTEIPLNITGMSVYLIPATNFLRTLSFLNVIYFGDVNGFGSTDILE